MVGVSLFYLLSGFVMAWTDRTTDSTWTFYRKRFARIYPAYFVACLLVIAWNTLGSGFNPTDLAALTLMQSWVPDREIYFAAQAIFWSLSCEAFFYLAFPAIRLVTRRLKMPGLAVLGAISFLTSIGIAVWGSTIPRATAGWAAVVFPPARLPEFVIGVVIGTLVARGWRPRLSLWWTGPLAIASVAIAILVPYPVNRYAVTLLPFILLILSLAVADIEGKTGIFRSRILVTLGVWSYCFYLIHGLMLWGTDYLARQFDLASLVSVPLAFGCSLLGAYLLHTIIEKPAEAFLRPKHAPARLDA